MFFRRERPKQITFEDRLENLRKAGFTVNNLPAGQFRVERGNCACVIEKIPGDLARMVLRPGLISGEEIAALIDGGFQKFFRTPSGRKKPALAGELKELHAFTEDFREALGQVSLYNESLGTVSTYYLYDRVEERDRGTHEPWKVKL